MSWNSEFTRLPLARWGIEPFEHEPAHGYVLRLAELNDQDSLATFAEALDLPRFVNPEAHFQFCMKLPIEGHADLRAATPVLAGNAVSLCNQIFRRGRHWSVERRKWCPLCVSEVPYHRNWFDLTILRGCPIHAIEFCEGVEGDRPSWNRPGFPSSSEQFNSIPDDLDWERYVLGRLNILPRTPVPLLDDSDIGEVVSACHKLGLLKLHGYSRRCPSPLYHADMRCVTAGFRVFVGGEDEIREAIEAACGHRGASPTARTSVQDILGWFTNQLRYVGDSPAGRHLAGVAHRLARERGCQMRSIPAKQVSAGIPHTEIADQLGMSAGRVINLAIHLGIAPKEYSRRRILLLSKDEIDELLDYGLRLWSIEQTKQFLGVTKGQLKSLSAAEPALRPVPIGPNSTVFDGPSVREWLASLKSLCRDMPLAPGTCSPSRLKAAGFGLKEIIKSVRNGTMPLVGWDPTTPDLQGMQLATGAFPRKRRRPPLKRLSLKQDVITSALAAAQLGVQGIVITKLIRAGKLATVMANPALVLLDRNQFDGFCKENAPASAYAPALGCYVPYAHRRLAELGVPITHSRKDVGVWLVDRQTADALTAEARKNLGDDQMMVARSLTDYLRNSRRRYLVGWNLRHDVALITDGTRRARARIFLDLGERKSLLWVDGNRKTAPRIKRILEINVQKLCDLFPNAVVHSGIDETYVREEFSICPDDLMPFCRWAEEAMDKLTGIMVPREHAPDE